MKTPILKLIVASSIALTLAACGGGGGGGGGDNSGGSGGGNDPTNNPPPTATNPIDPVTGNPTNSSPTNTVSGTVYANATSGAVVTAYAVQPDGSNGAELGTAAATGSDGRFSMTLNAKPTGMVRFVAAGGTYTSEADNSKQTVDQLELVAPYVTNELNSFVITPVTHIASRLLTYRAKNGATLVTAYNGAWDSTFTNLVGSNTPLRADSRRNVNILSTLPNSSADTGLTYQTLVTAFEWFGVKYDLPSKTVFRIAALNGESGFGPDGVDGTGAAINVGAWNGAMFDEGLAVTVDKLLELPKADPSAPTLHESMKNVVYYDLMRAFYLDAACKDASRQADTLARYPELDGFFGSSAEAGGCTAAANTIADLNTKATTNNRTLHMQE